MAGFLLFIGSIQRIKNFYLFMVLIPFINVQYSLVRKTDFISALFLGQKFFLVPFTTVNNSLSDNFLASEETFFEENVDNNDDGVQPTESFESTFDGPSISVLNRLADNENNFSISAEDDDLKKAQLPKKELSAYRPITVGEAGVQFAFSQLLGANLHLGHRSIAVDPRGMENMLGLRNDLYVINLLRSIQPLKAALYVLSVVIAKRGKALFTNFDKRALFSLVGPTLDFCFRYVLTARKWPGILTNFINIRHREPALRVSFQVPSYAYAVRRYDHHLAAEANILNIPSMTVYDSDTNPLATAFYPVSANDETLTSRLLFARLFFSIDP